MDTNDKFMDAIRVHADEWLVRMEKVIVDANLSFTAPYRIESEDMQEINFEWRALQSVDSKHLTVYIDEEGASYVRSWGGAHGPICDGHAEYNDTFLLLWQWLWS